MSLQVSDLIGEWRGGAPDKRIVSYIFREDGSVVWTVEAQEFGMDPNARYEVRETWPFWELDVFDFVDWRLREITFMGILQPINERTFKMQGTPSNHGGRPVDFDKEAIVFTKLTPNKSLQATATAPVS
jgi:hypothetical protein